MIAVERRIDFFTTYRPVGRSVIGRKKFVEELIAYFTLTRHGPHRKRRLQHALVAAGSYLPSRCVARRA
jgi:hypothetical protein